MGQRAGRVILRVDELEPRETPAAPGIAPGFPPPLAVSGPNDGVVTLYPSAFSTGQFSTLAGTVVPFPGFAGNVRTAFGDVNFDSIPDLVAITGPGAPVRFTVISGANMSTVLIPPTDPFGGNFTGGGFVAVGDINRDGRAEMVFSPDQGGGPRVVAYTFQSNVLLLQSSFLGINDPGFRGGARVAVGDINVDGFSDVTVAAGVGGGPRVAVYNGSTYFSVPIGATPPKLILNDFIAFPGSELVRDGVYVASGDINSDGLADLIFGAGDGGGPRVVALSGRLLLTSVATAQTSPLMNFFFGNPITRGGVRVAAKLTGAGTRAEVVVGSGSNLPSLVRVYPGTIPPPNTEPIPSQTIDPYGQTLVNGVFVG